MKKYANIVTAIINIIIVASIFILKTWDYTWISLYYGLRYDKITTIELFNELYAKIVCICIISSMFALVASSALIFIKKNINIAKVVQSLASVVIAVMYFLVHIKVFSLIADYCVCKLNASGFIVVLLCIANAVLSMAFVKEKINNIAKEDENVL